MPTYKSIFEAKIKKSKIYENIGDTLSLDVLAGADEPLSFQEEEEDENAEVVPGGEIIAYKDLPEDVKNVFRKVIVYVNDDSNHPESYEPLGYNFSLIYKKGKAIDFAGGFLMDMNDVDEEFYVSLKEKDKYGVNNFYKINMLAKSVEVDYNKKQ
jgi:hypothetical protein